LEENRSQLNYLSKYYIFAKKVITDPRFKACEEKDRDELFQDFIDQMGEEDRIFKRQQSEKKVELLIDELKSISLPVETTWHQMTSANSDTAAPFKLTSLWYESS